MAKVIKRNTYPLLAGILAVMMAVLTTTFVDTSEAAQVSSRSDILNNSQMSATSNHSISFTVQDNIVTQAATITSTLSVTFPSDFSLANVGCGDIDIATGTQFTLNCSSDGLDKSNEPMASSWGVVVNSTDRTITFQSPATGVYTHVATGTTIYISVGGHASHQHFGDSWIVNPSSAGTKTIAIGGSFGGTGNILVSILSGVQLSASVAETLTFNVYGTAGISGTNGASILSSCANNNATPSADDEDSTSANYVDTTALTVPFGNITSGNYYQGCQKLAVTTNAGSGYTVRVREDHAMRTAGALEIADTICDAGTCTASTAAAFTTAVGLGISCVHSATSQSCSTAVPNYTNGVNWTPIANETMANMTPGRLSGLAGATSVEVLTKTKFRLQIPGSQAAGTYTNTVNYIVTPVF